MVKSGPSQEPLKREERPRHSVHYVFPTKRSACEAPPTLRELRYIFHKYGRARTFGGATGAHSSRPISTRFHARRESEIDERTIKLLKVSHNFFHTQIYRFTPAFDWPPWQWHTKLAIECIRILNDTSYSILIRSQLDCRFLDSFTVVQVFCIAAQFLKHDILQIQVFILNASF